MWAEAWGYLANESDKKPGSPSGSQPRVSPGTGTQPRIAGSTGPRKAVDTMMQGSNATPTQRPLTGQQAAVRPSQPPPEPAPVLEKRADGDMYIGTNVAGRYKILRKLGEGGMGVVYLAEHVFIEKKVAIKILSDDFARKADLVARFMQEAKAASKIGHENIIDITDFGETASGSVFFVMEFLDGGDLAHFIREGGPMQIDRVRYIMNQICRALGAAHSKGIIHRDLKPENIYLVTREGAIDFVKILDFGIAKISSLDEGGSRLTRTGMIFGTPEYMSPEQARGDRPDHRVDIYAAGCILYEMLTGDVPFHAETFMGVLTKHMFEAPEPPTKRAPTQPISPEVEAVVMKALAKDRDQRYQTMKEMALALEEAVGGDPNRAWGSEGSSVSMAMPRGDTSRSIKVATPAPTTSPTTLTQPAVKKGKGALFGGLGLLVALGGVGAWLALRQPEPSPKPIEPPKVAVQPIDPPVVKDAPKPMVAAKIKIRVESTPPGADLFLGSERLGVTPASLEYKADTAAFDVVVKKKGFKDGKLHVTPITPEVKPEPKPEPKPAGKLRDLKDPFAN